MEENKLDKKKRNFFIIGGTIIVVVLAFKLYSDYRISKLA